MPDPLAALRARAEQWMCRFEDDKQGAFISSLDVEYCLIRDLLAAVEQGQPAPEQVKRLEQCIIEAEVELEAVGRPEGERLSKGIAALKARAEAAEARLRALQPLVSEIIQSLRNVRTLDIGAHYCRYCPAKSPAWEHGPGCPYVESQHEKDAANALIARLASLTQPGAASPNIKT